MSAPTSDYGVCKTCDKAIPTQADSRAHMDETLPEGGGKSHSIRILTPPREERARRDVGREVRDALDACMGNLEGLIDDGLYTAEEIAEALLWYSDFADAWTSWTGESA